eukprot:1140891-Amphidinium_carterae.1
MLAACQRPPQSPGCAQLPERSDEEGVPAMHSYQTRRTAKPPTNLEFDTINHVTAVDESMTTWFENRTLVLTSAMTGGTILQSAEGKAEGNSQQNP